MDLSRYKEKLQDPDFHQNLTKAHVYHASDLDEELKDLDREDQSVPSFTKALLSYLQVCTRWTVNDFLGSEFGIN
jgi:hypothetical protein